MNSAQIHSADGNEDHPANSPIYIVGRRHSGTTFLDVSLGSSNHIESLGEIVTGLHTGLSERMATGESLENSNYWTNARSSHLKRTGRELLDDGEYLYNLSNIKFFLHAYFSKLSSNSRWKDYADKNYDLISTLSDCSDSKTILDSNKEYTRCLMYLKGFPNSKILHLVRNPVPIAGSHYFRIKEKNMPVGFMKMHFKPGPFLFPILLVTVGISWSIGIIAVCLMKIKYKDRILDISYEKLCENPEAELERISNFISIDLSEVIDGVKNEQAFSVENNVGGNELRHEGSFTFVPNAKGRRHIPNIYKLGIHLVSLPGYALRKLFLRL